MRKLDNKMSGENMFDLTVIIPNYNNEKYLSKCIDSILSQSYQPKSIIVFDDCSTDHSMDILEEYQRQYMNIFIIRSTQNIGVSLARHTAIMQSDTKYVTMLDADDFYYNKDKLLNEMQTVMQYYEKTGKYGCSFSQVVLVNEAGKESHKAKYKNLDYMIRFRTVTRLFHNNVPRDFCFPKEAYIETGGYRTDICLYEDWDLDLKLLKSNEFLYSGVFGTAYRQKTTGLSQVNSSVHFAAKKQVFRDNKKILNYSFLEVAAFYFLLYLGYIKSFTNRIGGEKHYEN